MFHFVCMLEKPITRDMALEKSGKLEATNLLLYIILTLIQQCCIQMKLLLKLEYKNKSGNIYLAQVLKIGFGKLDLISYWENSGTTESKTLVYTLHNKMGLFPIIVHSFQLFTIVAKSSILNVKGFLDLPLHYISLLQKQSAGSSLSRQLYIHAYLCGKFLNKLEKHVLDPILLNLQH